MAVIYLYKKTHKVTGLKYLGKTVSATPYSYKGSGIYWRNHLKKHGNFVDTEILRECSSEEELMQWGQYYSKLWNVVESDEWANLKEEAGPAGRWSNKSKQKLSNTKKIELAQLTKDQHSARIKKTCSSPESWTEQRKKKISQALTGITRSESTREKISQAASSRSPEQKFRCGDKNRGKTWKLVDGKRVWMDKEK